MSNNSSGKSSFGSKILVVLVILGIITLLGKCNNSNSANKYSDTYYNDSTYRKNVNDIADTYDTSPSEVDRKINAVVDEVNK